MTYANALNVVGLAASLIGVILLFRYGMPFHVPTGGYSFYTTETPDPKVLAAERVYWWLGLLGLGLIVLATLAQIIAVFLP